MKNHLFMLTCSALAAPLSLLAQDKAWTFDSIPVLTRQAHGSPESQLGLLRETVLTGRSGASSPTKLDDRLRMAGPSWRMDVFGDGSAGEFLDIAVSGRAHESGVSSTRSMSATALESAGRAFVERNLSRVIILQAGERLVLSETSRRTEGGVAPGGGRPYSAVVANRVIFSREINGVPVTGAGSKVAVTILNDGSVESFRYDWPKYVATTRFLRMAPPTEVVRRIQRVSGIRTRRELKRPVQVPPSVQTVTERIRLGGGVQLRDLKCGYYDPGFLNRDPAAPVQAGCYYHVVETRGEGDYVTTAGYSGAVPAAVTTERDVRWPEANLILGTKVKGPPKPKGAGYGKRTQPVPPRPATGQQR